MASKTMQLCKYFCILQILFVHELNGWEMFHRGRRFGGNVRVVSPHQNDSLSAGDEWFTQKLDHLNPSETRTWQQRYFSDNQFYQSGGPVFLMISGEGPLSTYLMTAGAWVSYAQQHGALMFQVEHRYYGDSHPTSDLSTDNLQYLSSEQALADLADFIPAMNTQYNLPSDTKWIVFGGSYAGSLAAWMRLKYPNLVHGAVSSSGPILAKVDFQEYLRVVGESLGTSSEACVDSITQAFSQIEASLSNSDGQLDINQKFRTCNPIDINNPNDVANFYRSLASNFEQAVQYNSNSGDNGQINAICSTMTNDQYGTPVDRLAAAALGNRQCLPANYNDLINYLRVTTWGKDMYRQWTYQTCSEFGFFQTSTQPSAVFGDKIPASLYIQECADTFGPQFSSQYEDSAVAKTNSDYGGLNIDVTNVVFVHGSIDPWHPLGITQSTNANAPAIYIQGTSHCADLNGEIDSDLPELKAARTKISEYIGNWLRS